VSTVRGYRVIPAALVGMPDRMSDASLQAPLWPNAQAGLFRARLSSGSRFPSVEEAKNQALAALGDIAQDELPDGDEREFTVKVRDHGSEPILTARLQLHVERKL
jgi:hypothetical protein